MPRQARKKSVTQTYHVVIKGAGHQLLFEENKDYLKFLDILKYYKEECHFEIFAYCLMSNHVHLLIHTPITPIENIFRRINTKYAAWFNMKYDRTGHVMDGRYFSEPVDTDGYLLRAIRYIHFNPTKAGLENSPGTDYPWSSFSDYQRDSAKLADTEQVLSFAGGRKAFLEMHNHMVDEECLDVDKCRKRIPDDVAIDIILQQCKCDSVKELQKFSSDERNQHMILLHKKGISIRQLSRLTGIPKGVIERAINKALKIETKEASLKSR